MVPTTLHKYKDYIAEIKFSKEDDCYYGKVIGIHDSITFESDNQFDILIEFKKAVDDYLAFCEEKGRAPDAPNCKITSPRHPSNINLELDGVIAYDGVIVFRWSSDIGFGEYALAYDFENDRWVANSEHMDKGEDKEFLKELMRLFVDKIIVEE